MLGPIGPILATPGHRLFLPEILGTRLYRPVAFDLPMSDVYANKALNGHSNVTKKPLQAVWQLKKKSLMVTASSATISKPENELGVQAEQCTSWK